MSRAWRSTAAVPLTSKGLISSASVMQLGERARLARQRQDPVGGVDDGAFLGDEVEPVAQWVHEQDVVAHEGRDRPARVVGHVENDGGPVVGAPGVVDPAGRSARPRRRRRGTPAASSVTRRPGPGARPRPGARAACAASRRRPRTPAAGSWPARSCPRAAPCAGPRAAPRGARRRRGTPGDAARSTRWSESGVSGDTKVRCIVDAHVSRSNSGSCPPSAPCGTRTAVGPGHALEDFAGHRPGAGPAMVSGLAKGVWVKWTVWRSGRFSASTPGRRLKW